MTSQSQNGGFRVGLRRAFQTSILNTQRQKKKGGRKKKKKKKKKKIEEEEKRPAVSILSLPSLSTGPVMCTTEIT